MVTSEFGLTIRIELRKCQNLKHFRKSFSATLLIRMDQLDNLSRQKAAIEFLTRISSVPTLAINTDTVISSMLYDPGLDPVTSVKSHHSVISLHHSNSKEKSFINGIGQKDLRERDLTQQSRLTEELDKVQDFALSR